MFHMIDLKPVKKGEWLKTLLFVEKQLTKVTEGSS